MAMLSREQFLLDPTVVYLNHGAFGAVPRTVFETYQHWQRELETQPTYFFDHRLPELLVEARGRLAAFVHTDAANLVYIRNATSGINIIARGLQTLLNAGDEILTTDHEYGACDNTWAFICEQTGAQYRHVPLPLAPAESLIETFWAAVTPQTRIIYLSHLTSVTAMILPVAEICRRARAAGILTVIDGAHVPGHLPLDLDALGADFYTGNCHKWLCAPKGAAFLFARPEHHALLHPLAISWGYSDRQPDGANVYHREHPFALRHSWLGTEDPAAALTVPAALDFRAAHDWDSIYTTCHALAQETQARIAELTGVPPVQSDFGQMCIAPLPAGIDRATLKQRLYAAYRVEVPLTTWRGQHFVRVSFQAYNTRADADALLAALAALL